MLLRLNQVAATSWSHELAASTQAQVVVCSIEVTAKATPEAGLQLQADCANFFHQEGLTRLELPLMEGIRIS